MKELSEKEILEKLAEKVDTFIDKELDKLSIDRSYLRFKLTAQILSQDFKKMDEITLIEDDKTFCEFCGTRTDYYDSLRHMHLCASCFADIEKRK